MSTATVPVFVQVVPAGLDQETSPTEQPSEEPPTEGPSTTEVPAPTNRRPTDTTESPVTTTTQRPVTPRSSEPEGGGGVLALQAHVTGMAYVATFLPSCYRGIIRV